LNDSIGPDRLKGEAMFEHMLHIHNVERATRSLTRCCGAGNSRAGPIGGERMSTIGGNGTGCRSSFGSASFLDSGMVTHFID